MHSIWILGAADPEMAAIERLLSSRAECRVAYAIAETGERVHPGNAYRAIGFTRRDQPGDVGPVYVVECGGDLPRAAVSVDHHRPGDPCYGLPPAEFWRASSLGQVHAILGIAETEEDRLCAAADHCLAHAYRGLCPGIDPDALMAWRVRERAAFQGRPEAAVMADIDAARSILRRAERCRSCGGIADPRHHGLTLADAGTPGGLGGCGDAHSFARAVCPCCDGKWHSMLVDFRNAPNVPELPEAAAREGIAFLATAYDRDGRRKVVLQAADKGEVADFLRGGIVPGLVDLYGDPARGFAGGYLP